MTQQLTFGDSEYNHKRRKTRRERFLERMDQLVPWSTMVQVVEPDYFQGKGRGRPPYPLEVMLRIHCLQQWYNLSDEGMEDALYEITSMRRFARLSLDRPLPDRTTIMNFRHLLERHKLARRIFKEVNRWLEESGVILKEGTLVDATIIDAPSSTRNKDGQRDPEMHQTKKGNQWYFGLKNHIGVDARTALVHSFTTTVANQHDLNEAHKLLSGDEQYVFADAGYRGHDKRPELAKSRAYWFVSEPPAKVKALRKHPRKNEQALKAQRWISSIRSRVEHVFRVIKCQFGFRKTWYRGLAKNDNKLAMLLTLYNIHRLGQLMRA